MRRRGRVPATGEINDVIKGCSSVSTCRWRNPQLTGVLNTPPWPQAPTRSPHTHRAHTDPTHTQGTHTHTHHTTHKKKTQTGIHRGKHTDPHRYTNTDHTRTHTPPTMQSLTYMYTDIDTHTHTSPNTTTHTHTHTRTNARTHTHITLLGEVGVVGCLLTSGLTLGRVHLTAHAVV